ncbi:hypothetical protein HOLleu_26495 [Holothuria leucospilota]|uniref:Uncharacterized protein n=1 Tax=Holothuria leucospilota TaxID=206669 RepID=A0A9Q1H2I8_HOLLE|nr:hypothetical protein HOLleu_26495 [Holothuria leucospilota]
MDFKWMFVDEAFEDSSQLSHDFDYSWLFDDDQNHEPETKRPRGRPSLSSTHPDAVERAASFIQQNGFQADARRRGVTSRSSGVSVQDIADHVRNAVPALKETGVSKSTVRRWMKAPHEGRFASKRYEGLIDAKIPSKRNDFREENRDDHFHRAVVKYMREMCSHFQSECVVYSCDNMNKLKVGTLAVSRYHQLNRIYPSEDRPNYSDHDFPTPGYLIIPSGYMKLEPKVKKGTITKDSIGRDHIEYPVTGPLNIVLRAQPFAKATIETHMNDLKPLLKSDASRGQSFAVLIADGGPDWNITSPLTQIACMRLWKDCGLDGLVLTSFSAGNSAMNPIEHAWAPISKLLTGVTLPDKVPGESLPPCKQRNLSEDERKAKEEIVFNEAMGRVCQYLHGKQFDGHDINCSYVKCNAPQSGYKDHEELRQALVGPVGNLENHRLHNIRNDYTFAVKHMDRRLASLTF